MYIYLREYLHVRLCVCVVSRSMIFHFPPMRTNFPNSTVAVGDVVVLIRTHQHRRTRMWILLLLYPGIGVDIRTETIAQGWRRMGKYGKWCYCGQEPTTHHRTLYSLRIFSRALENYYPFSSIAEQQQPYPTQGAIMRHHTTHTGKLEKGKIMTINHQRRRSGSKGLLWSVSAVQFVSV